MVGGLAFVIKSTWVDAIEDIVSISERVVSLKLKGAIKTTIMNNSSSRALAEDTEKDRDIKLLNCSIEEHLRRGLTSGDFSVRIHERGSEEEAEYAGKRTFDADNSILGIAG